MRPRVAAWYSALLNLTMRSSDGTPLGTRRRGLSWAMGAVALCAALLLAGCVRLQHAPTPASLPCADPAAALERTGGIAGVRDQLVVGPTGMVTITRRGEEHTAQLQPGELDALWRELEAANLPALAAMPQGPTKGADMFLYRLSW